MLLAVCKNAPAAWSHIERQLTIDANDATSEDESCDKLLFRRKRRDTSIRVTLSRLQDLQMDWALAAHAVEKLSLGPTCNVSQHACVSL